MDLVIMTPLQKLIYEAIRFAHWAAGEGLCPADGEDAADPADFLFEYSQVTDDEDWDTLAYRAALKGGSNAK